MRRTNLSCIYLHKYILRWVFNLFNGNLYHVKIYNSQRWVAQHTITPQTYLIISLGSIFLSTLTPNKTSINIKSPPPHWSAKYIIYIAPASQHNLSAFSICPATKVIVNQKYTHTNTATIFSYRYRETNDIFFLIIYNHINICSQAHSWTMEITI